MPRYHARKSTKPFSEEHPVLAKVGGAFEKANKALNQFDKELGDAFTKKATSTKQRVRRGRSFFPRTAAKKTATSTKAK